jgi:uncharacterized phage protein (TIGR01671 family)
MREIKFRAWNEVSKKWDLSTQNFIRLVDGVYYFGNANMEGFPLKIMQYTGLKDKNGKEIYEGDVIACNYCDNDHGEVYWNKSGADFRIRWKDDCCANARLTRIDNWCAVIGNIYENPKLLTK